MTQLHYWRKHPPLHLLVAAYMGHKPPADASGPMSSAAIIERNERAFEEFASMATPMPEHMRNDQLNPYARKPNHVGQ